MRLELVIFVFFAATPAAFVGSNLPTPPKEVWGREEVEGKYILHLIALAARS